MSRRAITAASFYILLTTLLISGCTLHPDTALAPGTHANAPNILLIVTDDQRWDELGVVQKERQQDARFPFLQTPNLDSLAEQGIRFRNAFVTTSLCSPSRSSILTGQYVHAHGVMDNQTPFSAKPTWATALQESGYTTAYFGKWHHGGQRTRPGFDYFATFVGQGNYNDTPFLLSGEPKRITTKGYVDERSVDFLIDYLEIPKDEPFAAVLGLKGVHQPFTAMEQHIGGYSDNKISTPPNRTTIPPWSNFNETPPKSFGDRPMWNTILDAVRSVDTNVGQVLDALDALDLSDNTVVIFTSDNGYYLGEHTLGDKRSAYDESIRVPMIVRYPGVIPAGIISDALVLNIDIAPTIIGLTGTAIPREIHGSNLQPLLAAPNAPWRDAFLYEHWQLPYNEKKLPEGKPRSLGVLNILGTPTILALRTEQHKLVTYPGNPGYTELFDLSADPYETTNLFLAENYSTLRANLCRRLHEFLVETEYSYSAPIQKWLTESEFSDKKNTRYDDYSPAQEPPLFACDGDPLSGSNNTTPFTPLR